VRAFEDPEECSTLLVKLIAAAQTRVVHAVGHSRQSFPSVISASGDASSCCQLFCWTTCWSHGRLLLQLEVPQQCRLSLYESIDYASWGTTCCACPPGSALVWRVVHCACKAVSLGMLEHFRRNRQPCNTIMHAHACRMPLGFHAASFFVKPCAEHAPCTRVLACSLHGSHPASSLVPAAAAGESYMCLRWCLWQACQNQHCLPLCVVQPCNPMQQHG